ncbi:MAG: Rpn family recombination-promoting nuclease/putative transposase [Leptospiraceae bacterium]|nr:Rpn family recombination-promoting nuclease/putative transposase [Leptospiraceae bacterium]
MKKNNLKQKLSLTDNSIFKAVFGSNVDILIDLLNSFPSFQGEKKIIDLSILNPEIPKSRVSEKLSILDIKAEDKSGNQFIIEMQTLSHKFFDKRILYYWSKVYIGNLKRGFKYEKLKKVYSFNFLDFNLLNESKEFLSSFKILESRYNFPLTDELEINIIELGKFYKEINELKSNLDLWLFALKESENPDGKEMKTLVKKNPKIKKAIIHFKEMSAADLKREEIEIRKKTKMDIQAAMETNYEKGIEKGIIEGLEKTALKLLTKGMNLKFISETTELPIARIKELQKSLSKKRKKQ